ncbi:Uncharacterised protein [Turicibacter sanguinis]|nr:Uncharacterised protein [Turicibacter sanguinis]
MTYKAMNHDRDRFVDLLYDSLEKLLKIAISI